MDQRLDNTDLIHGTSMWAEPDADGNLVLHHSEWVMKRPTPSLAGCVPCTGCHVEVNLHEHPSGVCWRCQRNHRWHSEELSPTDKAMLANGPKVKGIKRGNR
jgi:hypothetical protein